MRNKIGNLLIFLGKKILGSEAVGSNQKDEEVSLPSIEKLLIRERYRKDFEVIKLIEKPQEWIIKLVEKEERIPPELEGKEVVLNGYKEMLEIIDYPFVGKPLYLQFQRRKWKEKGSKESYSNRYEIHPEGMKATQEFGDFLKELPRQERDEFFSSFPNIRHIRQEDF